MGVRQRRSWRFSTGCRQRVEHGAAGSWPLRVVFLISPSASCPAGVTRHKRAVRAGRVGSALSPARRAPCFSKWARMARMAVGSSMLATIRSVPPQWPQAFTSMPNTRLRRCAQVIARRRSMGVRWSALASVDSALVGGRLPRPEGVSCARNFAFGVKTPWKRVRCARGGGTNAASLAMTNRQDCRFGRPQVARRVAHREVRHQLHRLKLHVRRAVSPRRLELVTHLALRRER